MSGKNPSMFVNPVSAAESLQPDLNDISSCVSLQEFANLLQDLDVEPEKLERLHEKLQEKILNKCKKEIDKLFHEEDVIELLQKRNELSSIGIQVDGRAWRPPGKAKEHLRTMDINIYTQEMERLQKKLDEMNHENSILKEKVQTKREKFREREKKQLNIIDRCKNEIAEMKKLFEVADLNATELILKNNSLS